MAPQRRGVVPATNAAELQRLKAKLDKTRADLEKLREQRDKAIGNALKAGGSVREVSSLIGIDPSRISKTGHEQGWPTAEQEAAKQARADEREDYFRRTGIWR